MTIKKKIIILIIITLSFVVFYELVVGTRDVMADGVSAVLGLFFLVVLLLTFNYLFKKKPPKQGNN